MWLFWRSNLKSSKWSRSSVTENIQPSLQFHNSLVILQYFFQGLLRLERQFCCFISYKNPPSVSHHFHGQLLWYSAILNHLSTVECIFRVSLLNILLFRPVCKVGPFSFRLLGRLVVIFSAQQKLGLGKLLFYAVSYTPYFFIIYFSLIIPNFHM